MFTIVDLFELKRQSKITQKKTHHFAKVGTIRKKQGFAFLSMAEQIQYSSYSGNDSHAYLFAIVFN